MERGLNASKIDVVYNSIDISKYAKDAGERIRFREQHSLSPDKYVVVGAGSFVEVKGFHILIEAFALSVRENKNLHLLLAGDGPMKCAYLNKIQELGIEDKVTISPSYVKDIRPWLWAADLFVLPSISEPFGIITLEAMAANLPVIVSAEGGPSEVITNYVDGFIVPPSQPHVLSETINHVASFSQSELDRIIQQLELFGNKTTADRLIAVYDKVLAEKKS